MKVFQLLENEWNIQKPSSELEHLFLLQKARAIEALTYLKILCNKYDIRIWNLSTSWVDNAFIGAEEGGFLRFNICRVLDSYGVSLQELEKFKLKLDRVCAAKTAFVKAGGMFQS